MELNPGKRDLQSMGNGAINYIASGLVLKQGVIIKIGMIINTMVVEVFI